MKFFLLGLAIGFLLLLILISLFVGSKAEQPISFNHKKHLEQGMDCLTCHPYPKEQTFSGMPSLATCIECHKEPLTKNPEEEKIRQFQKQGRRDPLETSLPTARSCLLFSSAPCRSWKDRVPDLPRGYRAE